MLNIEPFRAQPIRGADARLAPFAARLCGDMSTCTRSVEKLYCTRVAAQEEAAAEIFSPKAVARRNRASRPATTRELICRAAPTAKSTSWAAVVASASPQRTPESFGHPESDRSPCPPWSWAMYWYCWVVVLNATYERSKARKLLDTCRAQHFTLRNRTSVVIVIVQPTVVACPRPSTAAWTSLQASDNGSWLL